MKKDTDRDEKTKKMKEKKNKEKFGSQFVRINPDRKKHDEYVTCGGIYNHINKSTKNLTKESTKKSLIDTF